MIKTIKGAMRSPRYKKQKLFVLTDVGAHFKLRYCVIGLPAEMYRLTRYFEKEAEACAYFERIFEENKHFAIEENRELESVNFSNKQRAAMVRELKKKYRRRFRRDCAFAKRKG